MRDTKIASYKAFEDYGLFQDGHVEDVKVKEVEGHFVFVGKVKPTMKSVTNEGKKFYKVWFVIDGDREDADSNSVGVTYVKWKPTAGSVFSAYCLCPGGQDGACKHVAACLYSLHDCLYPSSGPSDKLCYWKKKARGNTQPTPISNVKISKPSTTRKRSRLKKRAQKDPNSLSVTKRQRKDREPPLDTITHDPRPPYDRFQRTEN